MADPRRAQTLAADQLTVAIEARDGERQAAALRVIGLAARELQQADVAATFLRRSVNTALAHGKPHLAGESRMSLSLVLDDLGRSDQALREIDRALTLLSGLPLARARMQRGILLRRMGREPEALKAYGAALTSFRRHGDVLWQARTLTNRGVLQAYRGALKQAQADLARAEELYGSLGLAEAVSQVRHNRGFAAAQGGDIVSALDWYEQAEAHRRRMGDRHAVPLIDKAELLLSARLLPEAKAVALEAVEAATEARLGSLLPQARLLLARACLAAGDRSDARDAARLARRAFDRRGRVRWSVLARYIELRSTHDNPAKLAAIAADLHAAGWVEHAVEAHLAAFPVQAATTHQAIQSAITGNGPARLRIRAWHAEALSRLSQQDTPGAKRALLTGLRLLDRYRATLGATELRVLSSAEGAELAALGIKLALRERQPRQVLAWAERWRAATLRLRPAEPQHDPELTRDLAQLRRISTELEGQGDPKRRQRLLRRQQALEDAIRRRTWRTAGRSVTDTAVSPEQLVAGLAHKALVELIEQDGQLIAAVASGGKIYLRPLTTVDDVARESAALRFALRRLVLRHGSAASLAAADAAAKHALAQLSAWLIAPVKRLIQERSLVVVPTGSLQALPWSALPDLAGMSVTVAPSATAWWHSSSRRHPGRGTLLAAAANPAHAIPEVQTLAANLSPAAVLTGAAATVQATLSAMDGTRVAHIAAHGVFRADNPLFSQLSLYDGPLTGHDLTALRTAPALMVLSACDTGLSAVHPGNELMGLTATLLSAGTASLIASTGPVDDEVTRGLMLRLHQHLEAGLAPADALAKARTGAESWATAHSFSCFGA